MSEAARQQRVQFMVKDASAKYRRTMQRAFDGKASPREAIKAHCLVCVGYVREHIAQCTGYSCPLWAFRPFQDGQEDPEAEDGVVTHQKESCQMPEAVS